MLLFILAALLCVASAASTLDPISRGSKGYSKPYRPIRRGRRGQLGRRCRRDGKCQGRLTCKDDVCIRIVGVGQGCGNIARVCEDGLVCSEGPGPRKCEEAQAAYIGTSVSCLLTFEIVSTTSVQVSLPGLQTYEIPFDAATRTASGEVGVPSAGGCPEAGGPFDSTDYADAEVTFSEDFSSASATFVSCGTASPLSIPCTLVSEST